MGVDCTELMERIATLTGREVFLMCDAPKWGDGSDRWIAHVAALAYGKGATPMQALACLSRDLIHQKWLRPEELAV